MKISSVPLVAAAAEKAQRAEGEEADCGGFGDGDEFVDDAAGAVGGGVGDEGVEFAELVFAEAVDGEADWRGGTGGRASFVLAHDVHQALRVAGVAKPSDCCDTLY